jgi:type IV secretory pathway VirJ component
MNAPRPRARAVLAALLLGLGGAAAAAREPAVPAGVDDQAQQHLQAGRFGRVSVYVPQAKVRSVAIFLSGDGGWELGVINMARALREAGALVIGVDVRHYFASLRQAAARPAAPCQLIAADFENLSHQVQKQLGLADYLLPALVGYSSGATVVYAALVQSPPGTFAGALSLGFCADQDFAGAELCPGAGLHYEPNAQHELVFKPASSLRQPWVALQGQKDQVCSPQAAAEFAAAVSDGALVALPLVGHGFSVERNWMPQFLQAYARVSAQPATGSPAERPATISDLPLEEVAAAGSGAELALLLTGDGGWAGLDQELAARLAQQGIPTVALNSLRYFWRARTPEETAQAVERILRHYLSAWHKTRVLLIGYSFGADVLPFVTNRLPPELRAAIASVSLLGVDAHASFEVHLSEWVGGDDAGRETLPEVLRLPPVPVLCLSGAGERDSLCPQLPATITREQVGSGHHFGGEYATLAERILAFARRARPVT